MNSDIKKHHYRVCNYCEAMCGLDILHSSTIDSEDDIKIVGDRDDPFSKGAICPKAQALTPLYFDKEKLKYPVIKVDGEWRDISWLDAYTLIEYKIKKIQSKYGKDSVATYLGNPIVHNMGMMLFIKQFTQSIGSKNIFSATSMDQLPHHFVSHFMFGHEMRIPVPDINNTEHIIIIGANPIASNGSIMSASGVRKRLKQIISRDRKVVVIDPRKTQTAKVASKHYYIQPEADLYMLLALLHIAFRDDYVKLGRLEPYVKNIDEILSISKRVTPKIASSITRISKEDIEEIAEEFFKSHKAVIYGRMGVSTQSNGGLNQWLINLLNIVSGNFDVKGGAMFPTPAIPLVRTKYQESIYGRYHSRVSRLKEFSGELPISAMLEELESGGEGQVKAFISVCGNPVLSSPNGARLDRALKNIDFMVSIDNYINETSSHASIILPTPSGLEIDHYDLIFNAISVTNSAKYSQALIPPKSDRPYDWQVLKELTMRLDRKALGFVGRFLTPKMIINLGLLTGPYGKLSHPLRLFSGLSLSKVISSKHGVNLGSLKPSIPKALITKDKKIDLAPDIFLEALDDALKKPIDIGVDTIHTFRLIGRREVRSNNSWMHQVSELSSHKSVRCTALINTKDAIALNLVDRQKVRVISNVGEIIIPIEITDDIMKGVVSIPHGFGHTKDDTKISHAKANAGVSVNDITDNRRIDPLTSNIAFSGQQVILKRYIKGKE